MLPYPEARNIIVSKAPDQSYVLKTGNGKRGSLKMVSEFHPAEIIGLGLSVSTISLRLATVITIPKPGKDHTIDQQL